VQQPAVEDIGSEVRRTDLLANIADVFIASSLRFRTSTPINSYPIEHLSLGDLEMESSTWATLLPFIDLPTLRRFRFSSLTLPFIHISKFLAHHPRLTSLTLKGALRHPNQMVITPQICFSSPISISFPALRILEATSCTTGALGISWFALGGIELDVSLVCAGEGTVEGGIGIAEREEIPPSLW
jgi:hypothetical protein